jgi:hypothetical protein
MALLAHLLAAEGRLREMENRPADAARTYVEAIRFGNAMSRGGFLITRLVGVACEAIGYAPLEKLVSKLNPDDARVVLTALDKLDTGRVTWAEIQQSERRYLRYQIRKHVNPIMWVMGWWPGVFRLTCPYWFPSARALKLGTNGLSRRAGRASFSAPELRPWAARPEETVFSDGRAAADQLGLGYPLFISFG